MCIFAGIYTYVRIYVACTPTWEAISAISYLPLCDFPSRGWCQMLLIHLEKQKCASIVSLKPEEACSCFSGGFSSVGLVCSWIVWFPFLFLLVKQSSVYYILLKAFSQVFEHWIGIVWKRNFKLQLGFHSGLARLCLFLYSFSHATIVQMSCTPAHGKPLTHWVMNKG